MRRALPTAFFLVTAACAGADHAPSLAPRPIEALNTSEPAATESVAPPADPALAARYAAIVDAARQGDAAFAQEERAVRATADRARRSAVGSDPWIAAQQAITRLEARRAPIEKAAGDLDAERTSGVIDAAALDAATKTVSDIDAHERAQLAELGKMLPAP